MAKQVRNPNRFDHLQGKVRWGRCDICGLEYPESQITTIEGKATCIDDYESQGFEIGRQKLRNEGTSLAAAITARHKVPRYSGTDYISRADVGLILPAVTLVEQITVPNGGTVSATATGVNLSATNVTAVTASTGITISTILVEDPETLSFDVEHTSGPAGPKDLVIEFGPYGLSNTFRGVITVEA